MIYTSFGPFLIMAVAIGNRWKEETNLILLRWTSELGYYTVEWEWKYSSDHLIFKRTPLFPPPGIFCPSCVCTACTLTFTHHSFLPRYQASFCTFSISSIAHCGEDFQASNLDSCKVALFWFHYFNFGSTNQCSTIQCVFRPNFCLNWYFKRIIFWIFA